MAEIQRKLNPDKKLTLARRCLRKKNIMSIIKHITYTNNKTRNGNLVHHLNSLKAKYFQKGSFIKTESKTMMISGNEGRDR